MLSDSVQARDVFRCFVSLVMFIQLTNCTLRCSSHCHWFPPVFSTVRIKKERSWLDLSQRIPHPQRTVSPGTDGLERFRLAIQLQLPRIIPSSLTNQRFERSSSQFTSQNNQKGRSSPGVPCSPCSCRKSFTRATLGS